MSRFNFDDYDGDGPSITYEMQEWNLKRHLATTKGQAILREFRDALLAIPDRRLISSQLASSEDEVCAIGAYAVYKRSPRFSDWHSAVQSVHNQYQSIDVWGREIVPDSYETQDVGVRECGLNRTTAWMLAYQNDETFAGLTPEIRWQRTYDWVVGLIYDEVPV